MLVSTEELVEFLEKKQGGCRICSVTMLTPLKMNKTHRETKESNPFMLNGESMIDHLSERLVFIGAKYENMVNNAIRKNITPNADGYVPAFQAEALWKGKGHHLNDYLSEHIDTHALYLRLLYATIKQDTWIDKSLKQEAWLDRITGLQFTPNWDELAPYLPPAAKASRKQGCQEGADVVMDIDGENYVMHGGDNTKEIKVRMPHVENVLTIRSFDLRQPGKYEAIELKRSKYQMSL